MELQDKKEVGPKITMHFGGGSLFLVCHSCKQGPHSGEFAAEEVDFPGTPEQQKEPREKLERAKEQHLKDFHVIA